LQRAFVRRTVSLGHHAVDVAGHLPDFGREAAHLAQDFGGDARRPRAVIGQGKARSGGSTELRETYEAAEPA